MNNQDLSVIVIGGLNTDIVATGVTKLIGPGELTYGDKLYIGPGGKSRNIAQMIATLSEEENVAMIGKTSQDPYGLWKVPIDSLHAAKVNTQYISVTSYQECKELPGIALIPVDKQGENQIYVIPGINNSFSPEDIEKADELFQIVAVNKGILVLTLELPYRTALYAVKKASQLGIRVLFDPGGIEENKNYQEILSQKIFLLKPNEHETKVLTGIEVHDEESAHKAASKLLFMGVQNIFITMGSQGGYFLNQTDHALIPAPLVKNSSVKDSTGCGDQAMAAIAHEISLGTEIKNAVKIGVAAGTLQFQKNGIAPITRQELLVV